MLNPNYRAPQESNRGEFNGATNCHTKTIEKINTKQFIKTEVTAI